MFMKAVCHITCNLWKMNCYFLLFYAPRRGRKCQNYLALHLCRNTSTWRISAWTRSMSLCPRSLAEMRNLCVVYSPSINTPHTLWSLTPFSRSPTLLNSTKCREWKGEPGCWDCSAGETMELLGIPVLHPRTPSFTVAHCFICKTLLNRHVGSSVGSLHLG